MNKIDKTFADLRRKARETAATRWSRKELAQLALLKGAHQESIAPILDKCQVRILANGETLLRAGESCQALFLVLSGRLRIEDLAGTQIRAGDSIGELLLLERTVAASTIAALEPTRLLVIDRDSAWALIRKSHEIARNWLALFAQRTRVSATVAGSEEFKTSHTDQAAYDEHTGLHSRNWLEAMLPRQIARNRTGNQPLALLLIEIDGYTGYVARFGKAAGDWAQQAVAQTIIDCVRPTDQVIGYGIAQFAVVLLDSDAVAACRVGERVREGASRAKAPVPEQNILHNLTVSVGATQYQASTDATAFIAAAEVALHLARTSGGNRVAMQ